MTPSDLQERLHFLARVIKKEIKHLTYSSSQIYPQADSVLQPEVLEERLSDPQFAANLEAFTSRFCRLQDTLGDKLLPAWLLANGEQIKTAYENLSLVERLNMIPSAEEWVEIRLLRNQMVHEYIESIEILTDALNRAKAFQPQLEKFANQMIDVSMTS